MLDLTPIGFGVLIDPRRIFRIKIEQAEIGKRDLTLVETIKSLFGHYPDDFDKELVRTPARVVVTYVDGSVEGFRFTKEPPERQQKAAHQFAQNLGAAAADHRGRPFSELYYSDTDEQTNTAKPDAAAVH